MPPFAPLPVLIAAALGLVAGCAVRVLAGGFRPDVEPGPETGTGPQAAGEAGPGAAGGGSVREIDPVTLRRVYRAEARAAFGAMLRSWPVPGWPPLIETVTAVSCALLVWRHAGNPSLAVACWYAAVAGTALAVIDWRTMRLPDAIVLPSYPVLIALLAPSGRLGPALAWMLALGALYFVLWFVRPAGVGFGDVKLAGLIGLLTGTLGMTAPLLAVLAGHVLGAVYGVGRVLARRATRKSEFPFGPFLLAGALLVLLTG